MPGYCEDGMDVVPVQRVVMDAQKLERNVRARKAVNELLELAPALDGLDEQRFWEILAEEAGARVGLVLVPDGPAPKPMTLEEAVRFENEPVPFIKDKTVADISPRYWLKTQESEFNKKLRRYIMSQRFRDIQE